jgi:uncharacterized Tic20 family protein
MWYLAQTSNNFYNYQTPGSTNKGISATLIIFYLVLLVLVIAGHWKIFTKAGQAGWKVLIPIYNMIITLRIVGMSGWYVLLFLVPIVNIIFAIVVAYKLAKAFGYGVGMTILEFLIIGYLILGFGKAKYLGPSGGSQAPPTTS